MAQKYALKFMNSILYTGQIGTGLLAENLIKSVILLSMKVLLTIIILSHFLFDLQANQLCVKNHDRNQCVAVSKFLRPYQVCSNPNQPCVTGRCILNSHEIGFFLPMVEWKWMTDKYSFPFYAVIIKSFKCSSKINYNHLEKERLQIQSIFSNRKVFGHYGFSRGTCIFFDKGVKRGYCFMAIFASNDLKDGKMFLLKVRNKTKYKDAYLKKTTISYSDAH